MVIGFTLITILFAIFGLLVGSFLNVVILRHKKMTLQGRSQCLKCHNQLRWYELIPVISYIVQFGKCRNCKQSISWQYAAIELLTAVLFYLSSLYLFINIVTPGNIILSSISVISFLSIVSFGIIISVHDAKTRLVPFGWFLGLVVSTVIFLVSYNVMLGFYLPSFIPHILGIMIAVPFLFLFFISRGKWMGFADIELIAWMGLYLGIVTGFSAVLSAFYLGALFALVFIVYKLLKGSTYQSLRTTRIPFAPFLIISWFITVVFSWNIFSLIASLFV
ncbi:MAG TPA: prepilin peptidase [Candidatus Paceibacterota bacterium]|nr:prepilin peptidase [Candidatus Paceibacterota bacterium]